MINLAAVSSASGAGQYYSQDNYYTSSELTEASEWVGRGAEALNLRGRVDEQGFVAVLAGKLPDGSRIPIVHGEHRPGVDLTFSAPKSISLLALVGRDERIVGAFRESVNATLRWTEKNIVEARVWDPKARVQVPEKTGNMVAATFLHDVNRNNEPQLHIHAVIANATKASDGKWHAVYNDQLYRTQHLIGAVHNAELRSRIEALGYETVPARNPIGGAFEIKGVSRDVIEAFSTRRGEILEALAKEDRSSPRERELAALATRQAKNPEFSPEERNAAWQSTAERVGFDGRDLVGAALDRSGRQETIWSRVLDGVRGIGARGVAIASAMGLTPRNGDALVPERHGRLSPTEYAAAQAVASAARDLGEREAALDRNDLIRTALERGGPVLVTDIEDRIASLVDRGLLIGGERLTTTEAALKLEHLVIDLANTGRDAVAPLAQGDTVAAELQQAARDLGLRRLNSGQEKAGTDVLQSRNRVHLVQGGAGVGKSAAMMPVAHILKQEGRAVFALAHAGRTARDFGAKLDAPASTVDGFLGKFRHVLDGSAAPAQLAEARTSLAGSVLMVDEASQIGNERLARLIDLANTTDVARLVLAGDVRQLPAIEAGKPFEILQKEGLATSIVTDNLRAQSPQMQDLNIALESRDMSLAFEILKPDTLEVPFDKGPETVARLWVAAPQAERDRTLLLASGRAMRGAANVAVQGGRLARGELVGEARQTTVLDRVTVTREGARQMRGYQEGRIVEFRTNLPRQGFVRGDRGEVQAVEGDKVMLGMTDGSVREFMPDKLARNLSHDAVSIYQPKEIALFEGDRIRWTDNDRDRGLLNGDIAHIASIGRDSVTVLTRDGQRYELDPSDPMLERLDLAYAINVHIAQGMTADKGIVLMSEREKMLNTTQSFLVAVTRIAETATLVVDNVQSLERDVTRNPGGKTSAMEAAAPPNAKPELPVPVLELNLGFDIGL
ncbi:MAG TPA: MobF family relaxase [Sphingobium sp.]|uniref:MobF family relaxase n=1 Tax=Sphingobium sp. TaxID=1912891 RepID=UPI002ED0E117